jgi:hypothetical protein
VPGGIEQVTSADDFGIPVGAGLVEFHQASMEAPAVRGRDRGRLWSRLWRRV